MAKHELVVRFSSMTWLAMLSLLAVTTLVACGSDGVGQELESDSSSQEVSIVREIGEKQCAASESNHRCPCPAGTELLRFEHVAFNVPDPVATVAWYTANLGMRVKRAGGAPTYTSFIADAGGNMMLEFFYNSAYPLFDGASTNPVSLHFGFVAGAIVQVRDHLVAAGATVVEPLQRTASGDVLVTLRDPWGIPIQLVRRAQPLLDPEPLRAEHFAVNLTDVRAKAKWYLNNLCMKPLRRPTPFAPSLFLTDPGENMTLKFYRTGSAPALDFAQISHQSTHLAFMGPEPAVIRDQLLTAGATLVEDVTTTALGDLVLMLRDPWGEPIQFVKRLSPMLE